MSNPHSPIIRPPLVPIYGSMYISASALTTIAAQDTPIKASGTTTAGATLKNMTHTTGRMTYIGAPKLPILVCASLSLTSVGNGKLLAFHIAKNGVVIAASEQQRKAAAGGDVGNVSLTVEVELSTDDYVELWIENKTDSTDATINLMNMSIEGLPE